MLAHTKGIHLRGWVALSRSATLVYGGIACFAGAVAVAEEASDAFWRAAGLTAILCGIYVFLRAPFVGIWITGTSIRLRGWIRTRTILARPNARTFAERYNGALARGQSGLLWNIVVHDDVTGRDIPLHLTVTTERKAISRAADLQAMLRLPRA